MIGVLGQLFGGHLSGTGEQKANYKAKGNKERIRWQVENINEILDPIRSGLVDGLQSGGYLRRSLAVPGIHDALSEGANFRQASGDTAYRYGGRGFGRAAGYLDRANMAPAGAVTASMEGDAQAADLLARIDAAGRGAKNAFLPTQPRNEYAGYGQAISQFAQNLDQEYSY